MFSISVLPAQKDRPRVFMIQPDGIGFALRIVNGRSAGKGRTSAVINTAAEIVPGQAVDERFPVSVEVCEL